MIVLLDHCFSVIGGQILLDESVDSLLDKDLAQKLMKRIALSRETDKVRLCLSTLSIHSKGEKKRCIEEALGNESDFIRDCFTNPLAKSDKLASIERSMKRLEDPKTIATEMFYLARSSETGAFSEYPTYIKNLLQSAWAVEFRKCPPNYDDIIFQNIMETLDQAENSNLKKDTSFEK
jgi:hypothetical protein